MDPFLTILQRLSEHAVEYVLIGSLAAVAHGSSIVTQDVDVCAPLARPNLDRILEALKDLKPFFRRPGLKLPLFEDPARLAHIKNLYLNTTAGSVDILGELPGVGPYEQIRQTAVTANFGAFTCLMLDLDTLIAAKRAAGRPKDAIHLRQLLGLKKLKDAGGSTSLFDPPPGPQKT